MSASENGYYCEKWGAKRRPEFDDDYVSFDRSVLGYPFKDDEFGDIKEFWEEFVGVSSPANYGCIGRKISEEQDDFAYFVGVYLLGGRLEFYDVGDEPEGTVKISGMDEVGSQHGFYTRNTQYWQLDDWMKDIIELEDDFTWMRWDGSVT